MIEEIRKSKREFTSKTGLRSNIIIMSHDFLDNILSDRETSTRITFIKDSELMQYEDMKIIISDDAERFEVAYK